MNNRWIAVSLAVGILGFGVLVPTQAQEMPEVPRW